MELAGRFAAANHEVIHKQVLKAAGVKAVAVVENHHNFAWREQIAIRDIGSISEVIVHRKGATPAGKGVTGIIPGSMGDAGYVVRGKGQDVSLNSASHGAGRQMSRRQAKAELSKKERDAYLKERNIELIGSDLDEAPQAYKDIDAIMEAQSDLVDVIGKFMPRIVRMDDGKKSKQSKQARAERKTAYKRRNRGRH
jgi:tRNA-splicing ligase RtcB